MKGIRVFVAAFAAVALLAAAPVRRADTEVRVYLLEKETRKPVADLAGINATLEIEGRDGNKQKLKMEPVKGGMGGQEGLGAMPAAGYTKSMDKWLVEMFVLPSAGVVDDVKKKVAGFDVGHGGPYFKTTLNPEFQRDNVLKFDAAVVFDVNGERKSVKGYEYPVGHYGAVIDSLNEYWLDPLSDQIDDGKVENIGKATKQIVHSIQGLPELAMKGDAKHDPARAREEALTAARNLESGVKANGQPGKDAKDALKKQINDLKDKLNKLKDASEDATGARIGGIEKK